MYRFTNTHSLSDYPRLPISRYREQLRQAQTDQSIPSQVLLTKRDANQHTIKVTRTPANYGGYRYWWLCPKCGRRVAVLYDAGEYVWRHCLALGYATQLMQPLDRTFKRANAIRAKLGWQAGIANGIGSRPKGMHQRTFNKLLAEYQTLTDTIINETASRL